MSTSRIRLLVDLNVHEGKFGEFEALVRQMVSVSEMEPGTVGYHFTLSADRTRCRLIEGYADAGAVTAHFMGPAVQQLVPRLIQVATPTRMEFYGDPGPQVREVAAAFGAEIFSRGKASTGDLLHRMRKNPSLRSSESAHDFSPAAGALC